jgi:hypothetical protein
VTPSVRDLAEMLGKSVLVGITYVGAGNDPGRSVQFAGLVTAVHPLVTIDIGSDEPFTLPPDPEAFEAAPPGEYRLRSTGEVVVDPDFITSWTVRPPEE